MSLPPFRPRSADHAAAVYLDSGAQQRAAYAHVAAVCPPTTTGRKRGQVPELALAAVLAACGADAPAENRAESLEIDTVEVVGTAPLANVGTPLGQVPANAQALSGKALAAQHLTDVGDMLDRNLGSVTVNDTVGNPWQRDVLFRGFTASPLLGTPQGLSVFVDGVRVNEAFGDGVNWDLIPANAIANINLMPGSNPLFGLNTLGGSLAVHTKSGEENPGVSVTLEGGSWGRRSAALEAGTHVGEFDFFTAANLAHDDGWRTSSASNIRQWFGKAGWQDEKNNLDVTVNLADNVMQGIQSLPLEMLDHPDVAYSIPDSITNKLAMTSVNGSHFFRDTVLLGANAYYRHLRTDGINSNLNNDYPGDGNVSDSTSVACNGVLAPSRCDPLGANVLTTTDTDGFGAGTQLSFFDDVLGRKNHFAVGASADFGRTRFESDTQVATVVGIRTVSLKPYDVTQTVRLDGDNDYYGLFLTDTLEVLEKLHLTASGRYNIAAVDLHGTSLDITDDTLVPGNLDGKHRYYRFNPAVGLTYDALANLNVYGGYNEGMRAPSPIELACADPTHPCALPNAFGGDPNLAAVVSKTWEGGFRGTALTDMHWNTGYFRTRNSNDIAFIASSTSGAGYFQNVGATLRQGLEAGFNGRRGPMEFFANYAYVDATFESPFTASSASNSSADANGEIQVPRGAQLPGVPHHTFKARVDIHFTPAWHVGANLQVASSQYARGDENNEDVHGKIPGYAVVNLDTEYSFAKHWTVFAQVANLFDKDYATFGLLGVNEFTGPGRTFVSDPTQWNGTDQFRSPAAPRAGWVGVRFTSDAL